MQIRLACYSRQRVELHCGVGPSTFYGQLFWTAGFGAHRSGKGSSRQLESSSRTPDARIYHWLQCRFYAARRIWNQWEARRRTKTTTYRALIVPLGIPLGFPVPGGSSTSVHVAPHTDLYSRSHSLMHAVAVPKGVYWSCCPSISNALLPQ